MSSKASITVLLERSEAERLWRDPAYRPASIEGSDAAVRFVDAPGDRGTEIHVDLDRSVPGGRLGELARKLVPSDPRAKAMDDLRHFKQLAETGVIARSDGTPDGESAARKLKQRPAQPLEEAPREKAAV